MSKQRCIYWIMRILLILATQVAIARTITDMTGRTLDIPDQIEKIYCTSPVGIILLYTLAPEKLAGWHYKLAPSEKEFILPEYQDLPALGGWFGKAGTGNLEEILKAHPDLILSAGIIDQTSISLCERLQRQSGLPVLMIDGSLTQTDKTYRYLGEILNVHERAETLAGYCRQTLDEATSLTISIPTDKRPRVYYAEGPKGLETDPSGSYHAEILDLLGAVNVAKTPVLNSYGRTPVSMEQLLVWNPQIIIAGWEQRQEPGGFLEKIRNNTAWKNLNAVKTGRVYETPQYPFNWFDRPPSANRIIGIKWIRHLLYPTSFTTDLHKEVIEFYRLFYHIDISQEQVDRLLERAIPNMSPTSLNKEKLSS